MDSAQLKTTPLKAEHERLGARMVDFAGWFMPVQYEGVKEEHLAVRNAVGLFDVSHMGEIRVKGPKAVETLQWCTTNDISVLKKNQAHYSLFPNSMGGIVDDLIVYCVEPGAEYLLCVNASNADKDFAYLVKNNRGAELVNESSQWGQIAVQGPRAMSLLEKIYGPSVRDIPTFEFRELNFSGKSGQQKTLVARTGYTGEDGCEIFVPAENAVELWTTLLAQGAELGVKAIGLGARDTLRTEMKYSLYGNEIDDESNPYAAGLSWVVKASAKDFLGKNEMIAKKEKGLKSKLIGFEMLDRGIPRHGYALLAADTKEKIGVVTSGTFSPSLNESVGIAYIRSDLASLGSEFLVEVRERGVRARVIATPFVKNTSLKK